MDPEKEVRRGLTWLDALRSRADGSDRETFLLSLMMFKALDPQQQQSNLFHQIMTEIVNLLGPFGPNLQAIFVGDTGESEGKIFLVTN